MENRSHALFAGVFALLLGFSTVAALWWFGGKRELTNAYVVVTEKNVSGLNLQAQVRYRGVRVGKVESIELDPSDVSRTLIGISVVKTIPVTHGTTAKLGFQGVTGIAHVLLEESGKDATPLATGTGEASRIPMQNSLIEELSETGGQTLRSARELLDSANQLLNAENRQLFAKTLVNLEATSENSREASARLRDLLSPQTIASMNSSLAHIDRAAGQAAPFFAEARSLVARWQTVGEKLESTLVDQSAGNGLIPKLNDLSADLSSNSHQLDRLLKMLEDSPQSLIFGRPRAQPGPGEAGFVSPGAAGGQP